MIVKIDNDFIQNLRQDYKSKSLSESDIDQNPIQQFKIWFEEALQAKLNEPNAMTLATADKNGKPSARIVLLKGLEENGFIFYTNYWSRKGANIAENPHAALVFFWGDLERQVRVEGEISKISGELSSAYFNSRPLGSKIGATISPQSKVIASREELELACKALEEKHKDGIIPRPENWGGYILKPNYIEFWQGRSSRLHDRLRFKLENNVWTLERLAP